MNGRIGTAIVGEPDIAAHDVGVGIHEAAGRVGGVFTNDEAGKGPIAVEIELLVSCDQPVVSIAWGAKDIDITA